MNSSSRGLYGNMTCESHSMKWLLRSDSKRCHGYDDAMMTKWILNQGIHSARSTAPSVPPCRTGCRSSCGAPSPWSRRCPRRCPRAPPGPRAPPRPRAWPRRCPGTYRPSGPRAGTGALRVGSDLSCSPNTHTSVVNRSAARHCTRSGCRRIYCLLLHLSVTRFNIFIAINHIVLVS